MPASLHCPACDATYADRWRCTCGHPLDFAACPLPDRSAPDFADLDTRDGLWTFDEFLPVEPHTTFGEGWTPLVDAPDWDCAFKLEYVSPTGSFKDRGAATTIARALAVGADRLIEDSSGNAGTAIATYAARAGLDADIYVPADAKPAKLRAIERVGATLHPVEGSREAVTDAAIDAVEHNEGWYASHAWNPAFFAGTGTFAFEVAAQRDWSVPDAVVCPLGHGTLFLGAYRGFRALHDAGWTDQTPRLLGAQATGYDPIAGSETTDNNDLADGIHIREPVRADEIREAIERTDGDAIAIDAEHTDREHGHLARAGFNVEPTCAVATAALQKYRDRGTLDDADDVVVPLTGTGLKN